jgi:L-threonylcarbamoyladenylate synthase
LASQPTIHESLEAAVERLSAEGLVAYPTETIWGLGACADRPQAVARLFAWKGRRNDQPMSVLVRSIESAIRIGCRLDERAERLARAFWPGPLTIVVSCERRFASGVARGDGALGLRCSSHPIAGLLATALDDAGLGPLTSTSLNRTGCTPAVDVAAAEAMTSGGREDGLESPLLFSTLESGLVCDAGAERPSSVVDCTGPEPKILRAGAIEADRLEKAWARGTSL